MDDTAERALPLRMVVEHVYCPRLFHYMHVEGVMAANEHVWRGRQQHVRSDSAGSSRARRHVDAPDRATEGPPDEWREARAVALGDSTLGLVAKLDAVLLRDDGAAIPTELKSGNAPEPDSTWCTLSPGAWDADVIQVALQALLLEEAGYRVPRGELYYQGNRVRVEVPLTPALRARAIAAVEDARRAQSASERPEPLVDSPKCRGCSLAEVCLPAESRLLREGVAIDPVDDDAEAPPGVVRRLRVIARDTETRTVTVSTPGATVRKEGEALVVAPPPHQEGGRPVRVALDAVAELVLLGNVSVSTQTLCALFERGVTVSFHSGTGRLLGSVGAGFGNNGRLRARQHAVASEPASAMAIGREFIRGKLHNQRVLLRRNGGLSTEADHELTSMLRAIDGCETVPDLMGVEGTASRFYFDGYAGLVAARGGEGFRMDGRNRRPPRDPVNAMLSFGYAVLARECAEVLRRVGFDPMRGVMHGLGWGRASLALDLMEEFRPLLVDSAVLRVVAERRVGVEDFQRELQAVTMSAAARRALLQALDQRREEEITHPVFGYRVSYRRAMELQARILARVVEGEAPRYIALTNR